MGITSQDQTARAGQSLFDHELMADSLSNVVKVFDSMCLHELSDLLMASGVLFRGSRSDMIQNDDGKGRTGETIVLQLRSDFSDDGRSIIV